MTTLPAAHEVIASRRTADGELVQFWSDGAATVGHPMNNRLVARDLPRRVLWKLADEVCLYDAAEMRALVKAARKAHDAVMFSTYIERTNKEAEILRLLRVFAFRACAAVAS